MIDTAPTFEFPAVRAKKITAAFDGGRISSDGGVMLLAGIERRLGIADRLAKLVPDRRAAPASITLDIDDTCDVVHGRQQLSLFNAHYDEYCSCRSTSTTATGRPVAMVLRPGKTPSGVEVRAHIRRLHRRIRAQWPATRITIRGDGHYARPEAMDFCEAHAFIISSA